MALAKFEPNLVYVHQTKAYGGREPHIFIWHILSRRIVRRFHPLNEAIDLE